MKSYSKINKKLIKMSKVKLGINGFGRIGRIVLENL
jgi:phosphoglycerate dehydrogenase-like enzyme